MAIIAASKEVEQRRLEVENALATVRLEGLEPSSEAHAICDLYRRGEISFDEMRQMFFTRLGIPNGSLPLPEHNGSQKSSESPRS